MPPPSLETALLKKMNRDRGQRLMWMCGRISMRGVKLPGSKIMRRRIIKKSRRCTPVITMEGMGTSGSRRGGVGWSVEPFWLYRFSTHTVLLLQSVSHLHKTLPLSTIIYANLSPNMSLPQCGIPNNPTPWTNLTSPFSLNINSI